MYLKTEQVKCQAETLRRIEYQEFERRLAEEKLRQSEERAAEIRRLNEELEQRVAAPTQELEAANQELAREVAEREARAQNWRVRTETLNSLPMLPRTI